MELEDCLEKQEDVIFEAIEMKKLQGVTKRTYVFEVHVESWKAILTYLGLQVD